MEIDRKNGSILTIILPGRFEKHINSIKNVIFSGPFFSKMFSFKYISPIVAAAAAAAAAHDHHIMMIIMIIIIIMMIIMMIDHDDPWMIQMDRPWSEWVRMGRIGIAMARTGRESSSNILRVMKIPKAAKQNKSKIFFEIYVSSFF